jgi:hypothetical protein
MSLVRLEPSARKKWVAVFSDGSKVHFGGRGCMDYTMYHERDGETTARAKRRAYIERHRVNESWDDPKMPGTLSRYILWEYPTVTKAVRMYKKRFAKT